MATESSCHPEKSSSSSTVVDVNAMDSLETIGQGMAELYEAIRDLANLGIERSDIPVPKIVVVGDQSAGKSSLVEAMSEIRVPRDAGTCTRVRFHAFPAARLC